MFCAQVIRPLPVSRHPYHIIMKSLLTLALVSTGLLLSSCANGHCLFAKKKDSCSSCCAPAAKTTASACCATPAKKK